MKTVRLSVANGALLECPVYEPHTRGSNWAAIIDVDGTAPGGLSRRWLPRGKGECFYLIEQLAVFDPVEFAADYVTYAGRKRPARFYGVVVAKTDDYVLVEECESGATAVLLAKKKRESGEARKAALLAERQNLFDRAAKLTEEIEVLEEEATVSAVTEAAMFNARQLGWCACTEPTRLERRSTICSTCEKVIPTHRGKVDPKTGRQAVYDFTKIVHCLQPSSTPTSSGCNTGTNAGCTCECASCNGRTWVDVPK